MDFFILVLLEVLKWFGDFFGCFDLYIVDIIKEEGKEFGLSIFIIDFVIFSFVFLVIFKEVLFWELFNSCRVGLLFIGLIRIGSIKV